MAARSSAETSTTLADEDSRPISRSTAATSTPMPWPCCSSSTCSVTAAVTCGLPSRSPPVQVPKLSGRACGSSRAPCACDLVGQVGQQLRHGPGGQVVQVVGGVAGLVHRVRAVQPQLVGLPDQVDDGGQPAVLPAPGGGVGGRVGGGQHLADLAQLVQDRAAARLGRVRGEDRPDGERAERLGRARPRRPARPPRRPPRPASRGPPAGSRSRAPGAPARPGWPGRSRRRRRGPGRSRWAAGRRRAAGAARPARPARSALEALVRPRTRSTRSSSCCPSCRTSDSPSSVPTRRTSARSAASGSPPEGAGLPGTSSPSGSASVPPRWGCAGSAGRRRASGARSPSTRTTSILTDRRSGPRTAPTNLPAPAPRTAREPPRTPATRPAPYDPRRTLWLSVAVAAALSTGRVIAVAKYAWKSPGDQCHITFSYDPARTDTSQGPGTCFFQDAFTLRDRTRYLCPRSWGDPRAPARAGDEGQEHRF